MVDVSQFDPQTFLDATTTEAATRRPPLPVDNPASPDGLYTGVIGEPKIRTWQGKKDPTQSGIALDVPIEVEVPQQVQDQLGIKLEKGTLRLTDGFIVNLTPAGMIDWSVGANGAARRYRDATDTNTQGQAFNFRMFQGKVVKVKVTHEVFNNDIVDKVGNVLKA